MSEVIVSKNFDMKIKIDDEIVSNYFSKANDAEIESLLDYIKNNCDQDVLKLTVGKYLQRLRESDQKAFNAFVGNSDHKETKTEKLEETRSNGYNGLSFDVGDYIFIRDGGVSGSSSSYNRYLVDSFKLCFVYISDGAYWRKYRIEDVEQAIRSGEIFVSKVVRK